MWWPGLITILYGKSTFHCGCRLTVRTLGFQLSNGEFNSPQPHQFMLVWINGPSVSRGGTVFRPPVIYWLIKVEILLRAPFHAGVAQLDRASGYEPESFVGVRVLPPVPFHRSEAQSAEQLALTQQEVGSIPTTPTIYVEEEKKPKRSL